MREKATKKSRRHYGEVKDSEKVQDSIHQK